MKRSILWDIILNSQYIQSQSLGFLWPVMDSQGLRTLGVYSIPSECGHVQTGQTGCLSNMRLKEHHEYVWPEHSNRSAKAQHHIHRQNTSILSTKPMDGTRMSREVTNTELHFNNMNMEDGICFRKSWKTLVSLMNDCKKPPSPNPLVGFSNGSQRSMNTTLTGYILSLSSYSSTLDLSFLLSLSPLSLLFL